MINHWAVWILGVFISVQGVSQEIVAPERPDRWAPALSDHQGLTNLHKVSDDLYRGAQPDESGFASLKKLGIKTVINLRTFHSDRKDCERNDLNYIHIRVQAWEGEDEEVVEFLQAVTDEENQPVFLHCLHGADRTGVMSAVYRIIVQGWTKQDAIAEMTRGGFGFHSIWQNLVRYVEELDIQKIKEQSGLMDPADASEPDVPPRP